MKMPPMANPIVKLANLARNLNCDPDSELFAQELDKLDELRQFRERFVFPKLSDLPRGE